MCVSAVLTGFILGLLVFFFLGGGLRSAAVPHAEEDQLYSEESVSITKGTRASVMFSLQEER